MWELDLIDYQMIIKGVSQSTVKNTVYACHANPLPPVLPLQG